MKVRSSLVAIAAAVAIATPTVAFAASFQLENKTDAWVHLSINFPIPTAPPVPQPPPGVCIAPNGSVTGALPASQTHSVYLIALSGANCYAPRLWEHGVTIDGKGSTVTIGQSGATGAVNSTDAVRIENHSAAWVHLSVLPETNAKANVPKFVPPAVTSFCVAPAGHVTTLDDFPSNSKAYVIVLAGKDCYAPRLHEQNANGDRIVVKGEHGAYTVTAGP